MAKKEADEEIKAGDFYGQPEQGEEARVVTNMGKVEETLDAGKKEDTSAFSKKVMTPGELDAFVSQFFSAPTPQGKKAMVLTYTEKGEVRSTLVEKESVYVWIVASGMATDNEMYCALVNDAYSSRD